MSDDADDPHAAPYGRQAPDGGLRPAGYPEGRIPAVPEPRRARLGGASRTAGPQHRVPGGRAPGAGRRIPATGALPPVPSALRSEAGGPLVIRPEGSGPASTEAEARPDAAAAAPPGRVPSYVHGRTRQVADRVGAKPAVRSGGAHGHRRRPLRRPRTGISEARGAITVDPDRAPPRPPTAPSTTSSPGLRHRPGTPRTPR
ncbi:hypothetical protein DEJ51_06840 [Streptomyces venezuelae]|uniref:Uncharacterized protein n=1 Tax=Streptomyces venezuelae TaxID=54571 RepID=A0A5P2DFW1_STRVZ|nr:hypothetical protein [Streptomyces venezuelae]QES53996.1 hypothetical protein DEJ51_06840 [Streptomyces venezuelae]